MRGGGKNLSLRYRIDRTLRPYEISAAQFPDGVELLRRISRRLKVGELINWQGEVLERVDARQYRGQRFSKADEQQQDLFQEA